MGQKQKLIYALSGFALGVLLTCGVWLCVGGDHSCIASTPEDEPPGASTVPGGKTDETAAPAESAVQNSDSPSLSDPPSSTWDRSLVYIGGDAVSYEGRRYRAKWWTQGEAPGSSDVWEDLGNVDGEPAQPQGVDNVPIDASTPQNTELADFKVVGYYPSWKPNRLQAVDFGVVTHVCYAFAIPTAEGGLLELENPVNEGRSIEQGNWTVQYFYPYFISKSLIFQAFLFLRCNCKIG